MELNKELLEQLKSHVNAIKIAMPELSKEERTKIITKSITDSTDIPKELQEETIKILLDFDN